MISSFNIIFYFMQAKSNMEHYISEGHDRMAMKCKMLLLVWFCL